MSAFKPAPQMSKEARAAVMQDRLARAKALKPLGSYVKRGPAGIEEVTCKICGTPLRKLVPDERFREARIIGNKEVVTERLIFMTLATYNEVAIHFDDGSRHISIVCTSCAPKLVNEDLEWLYMSDVADMMVDAGPDGMNLAYYAHRIPVSFVLTPPGQVTA